MLILDTETTGLSANDEICEIAILNGDGEVLMDTRIKPTISIPQAATNVHGITNEAVADAPTWAQVHDDFMNIISGEILQIYNADFDVRILRQTMQKHALVAEGMRANCVMKDYARFYGRKTGNENMRWQKLSAAAEQCGVEVANAHRALGDCYMLLGIINYMQNANAHA